MRTTKISVEVNREINREKFYENINIIIVNAFFNKIDVIMESLEIDVPNKNAYSDIIEEQLRKHNTCSFKVQDNIAISQCTITINDEGYFISIIPLEPCLVTNNNKYINIKEYAKMLLTLCSNLAIYKITTEISNL